MDTASTPDGEQVVVVSEGESPSHDTVEHEEALIRVESQEEFSFNFQGSGSMDISFKEEQEEEIVNQLSGLSTQDETLPERYRSFMSIDDAKVTGLAIDKRSPLEFERRESPPGVPRPRVIWRPDNSTSFCVGCHRFFTFFLRKHHCRGCGNIFCDACSGWQILLPQDFALPHQEKILSPEEIFPQRVCKGCFEILSNGTAQSVTSELPRGQHEPKNILILAIGCHGNARPYASLGKSLQDRGHGVTIASDASNEDLITKHGLSFILMPGNLSESLDEANLGQEFMSRKRLFSRSNTSLNTIVEDHIGQWQDVIYDTVNMHAFDMVILSTLSVYVALSTLEHKTDIPFIVSWLFPYAPTKYYAPPSAGESDSWFQFVNQIKWNLFHSLSWSEYKKKVNEQREKLGLRPFSNEKISDILTDMNVPCMGNWSPAIFDKPPDWESNIEITGQLILEQDDFRPSVELTSFLKGGAPVYIGFGNSPEVCADSVLQCIQNCCEALEVTKSRAIISCSDDLALRLMPTIEHMKEDVFFVDFVPHEWLFPQCKFVIIHGGVGTTMTALRHGIIPIILSTTSDQGFWGDLLARKGYAPKSQVLSKCTTAHLLQVLNIAATDEEMWERVQSVSSRMKGEQGNQRAVEFIERNMNFQPRWPSHLAPEEQE